MTITRLLTTHSSRFIRDFWRVTTRNDCGGSRTIPSASVTPVTAGTAWLSGSVSSAVAPWIGDPVSASTTLTASATLSLLVHVRRGRRLKSTLSRHTSRRPARGTAINMVRSLKVGSLIALTTLFVIESRIPHAESAQYAEIDSECVRYMPVDMHAVWHTMGMSIGIQEDAMMNATGYVRVSTLDQANEGVSLDAQKARIAAWCLANDVELGDVFVDAGLSGKRADNRPALQDALAAVCRDKGVLVVYSLSRLARSTKDTITIGERLAKAGADMVSLSEKIDTTSAAGKMVFRMLAVMAEFERDLVSERTTLALAHKKGRGERVGALPFGFDLADDGVSLKVNAEEQAIIAAVRELRAEGLSIRKIVEEMNRRGIATKEGGRWHVATVQRVLKIVA